MSPQVLIDLSFDDSLSQCGEQELGAARCCLARTMRIVALSQLRRGTVHPQCSFVIVESVLQTTVNSELEAMV